MRSESDEVWRDPRRGVAERVADLLGRMTLAEKIAQLYGVWLGASDMDGEVAPFQHELVDPVLDWPELIKHGLGQLTRPLGSAPVTPAAGTARTTTTTSSRTAPRTRGPPRCHHARCPIRRSPAGCGIR